MEIRQFVSELKKALQQQQVNKSLQLGKGQCATIEDYKKIVGYIAGLDGACVIADKMLSQLDDAQREADNKLPEMQTGANK